MKPKKPTKLSLSKILQSIFLINLNMTLSKNYQKCMKHDNRIAIFGFLKNKQDYGV